MLIDLKQDYKIKFLNLNSVVDVKKELLNINADKKYVDLSIPNMDYVFIKVEQIDTRQANIIKKFISEHNCEAVLSEDANSYTSRTTDMIISGSRKMLNIVFRKLSNNSDVEEISKEIEKALNDKSYIINLGKYSYDFNKQTHIIGSIDIKKYILKLSSIESKILNKVEKYVSKNVNIIELKNVLFINGSLIAKDLTKESVALLCKVIYLIKKRFPNIIVGSDSIKLDYAKEVIESGLDYVIVDIPVRHSLDLIKLLSKLNTTMFLRYHPYDNKMNNKTLSEIIREFQGNLSFINSVGFDHTKLIFDSNINFGNNANENYYYLKLLVGLKGIKHPIISTLDKKNFLNSKTYKFLNKANLNSSLCNILSIINNTNILRVNSVNDAELFNEVLNICKN